jgi:hypothetical protein
MLKLKVLENLYTVIRLEPTEAIPTWVLEPSKFYSISKTDDELSIVCDQTIVSTECSGKQEKDWRIIKVLGPLEFSMTGVLAKLANPLAEAKISIFAISTFDTDYLLVKNDTLADAINILNEDTNIDIR